jgi:hypothetical protein
MTTARAVVKIDHRSATVLPLDAAGAVRTIRPHSHPTAQHHSDVRTEHEFLADVCDALDACSQALVAGPHTALADLRHYLEKHRPRTASRLIGFEVVDHPTDPQLLALARQRFTAFDTLATPG